MIKIRLSDLSVGIALCCCFTSASTTLGQIVVQGYPLAGPMPSGFISKPSATTATPQHLGSGPIDRNNLPADVLNCDVCRQRLGLPPLSQAGILPGRVTLKLPSVIPSQPKFETIAPQKLDAPPVPMLGSPGLISSGTASQLAAQGFVVQEFIPPQIQPDAIQLGDIPPEIRQQFINGLELPPGARVMSAKIKGRIAESNVGELLLDEPKYESIAANQQDNATTISSSIELQSEIEVNPSTKKTTSNTRELVAPGITSKTELEPLPRDTVPSALKEVESPFSSQELAKKQADESAKKQAELELAVSDKMAALNNERDNLAKERAIMRAQLEQLQADWQKRMELADAANKEALSMLEKRTAEVTELQLQLKLQKEAVAKSKSDDAKGSNADPTKPAVKKKPESKKRDQSKGKDEDKKPNNPTIDT